MEWKKKRTYGVFGAFGTAGEGAEKEDGDGTGEEETGGGLEESGVICGGENGAH